MKYLERTNKSVDRMINIVEDLEVISRLETEEYTLDIQPFNIVSLAKDVFDALEMKANKMNINRIIDQTSPNSNKNKKKKNRTRFDRTSGGPSTYAYVYICIYVCMHR